MQIKVWPMLLVRVQVKDGKWYPQSNLVTLLFTLLPAVQESNDETPWKVMRLLLAS